jgi:hypothetical protein
VIDAYIAEVNNVESKSASPSWYLDSGATNHVSGDSKLFSSLTAKQGTKITSAGGQGHDVIGIGNVAIRLPNGEIQKISHVLYSPGIMKNLLSVGFLTDKGYNLTFMRDKCIIKDPVGNLLATALRDARNGLYRLIGDTLLNCSETFHSSTEFALSCTTASLSSSDLWHRRLDHYHPQGLRRMISSHAVKGLSNIRISNNMCHSCLGGKQTRTSVPKERTNYTTQVLELVHTDVAGPFRVQSLGGSSYFLTFIDDFSKRTWVYFLRTKSECFDKFQSFHQEVEKLSGRRIITLRSDNGGEFTSRSFNNYCSIHGIRRCSAMLQEAGHGVELSMIGLCRKFESWTRKK